MVGRIILLPLNAWVRCYLSSPTAVAYLSVYHSWESVV